MCHSFVLNSRKELFQMKSIDFYELHKTDDELSPEVRDPVFLLPLCHLATVKALFVGVVLK